jgi:uncharacterized C2H2 Zn-finger protein
MKWTIKLVFDAVPGSPVEHELGIIKRAEEISPATVGLTIAEGKALLASLQEQVVTAQVQRQVATFKACPQCGNAFRTKGHYQSTLRSVYGTVGMRIRRLILLCHKRWTPQNGHRQSRRSRERARMSRAE